jgi:hypothetical protein
MSARADEYLDGKLRKIWAHVLSTETIADEDNFFMLGGGSRDVIVAAAMVNAELEARVRFTTFFRFPVFQDFRDQLMADMEDGGIL